MNTETLIEVLEGALEGTNYQWKPYKTKVNKVCVGVKLYDVTDLFNLGVRLCQEDEEIAENLNNPEFDKEESIAYWPQFEITSSPK